ncbi:MAG: hypothetical protein OIF57_00865 [Marinobacterium sp.]|nr:hypothetical protein [Marinobacterium sp.]
MGGLQVELDTIPIFTRLDAARQLVLANMAYNLGVPRLKGFRKMWRALEQGDYKLAAAEMLDSRWARQVGKRATELAEQRRAGTLPEAC